MTWEFSIDTESCQRVLEREYEAKISAQTKDETVHLSTTQIPLHIRCEELNLHPQIAHLGVSSLVSQSCRIKRF